MKRIVAFDLGSKTGVAHNLCGFSATTWELATTKELVYAKKLRCDRRLDIRVHRLLFKLSELKNAFDVSGFPIDIIVFEDVRFASSQAQAHLWGSFRGAVWAFAAERGIDTDCLDTGKLKKFATGSGAADKEAMRAAWIKKYPSQLINGKSLSSQALDDNAIDALHLLHWANNLSNK